MTGFVAMPGSMGSWYGGDFGSAHCVLAGNPGPMTLDGTNTWLLWADPDSVVLVDPGPDAPEHLAAVEKVLDGRRVRHILLTHGHADHSAGARLFSETLRAPVRALDPYHRLGDEGLEPGAVIEFADLTIEVVGTPGHTSDSVSMYLPRQAALLTGDTVLGRGTTVVAHPDGRLRDYLDSLNRLHELVAERDATQVWPGHGPALPDAAAALRAYLEHREQRLEQVREAVLLLEPGLLRPALAKRVVELVYADVPRAVWPAAELSVLAQLDYLDSTA